MMDCNKCPLKTTAGGFFKDGQACESCKAREGYVMDEKTMQRVKENLCCYDELSPYFNKDHGPRKKDCCCDTCYHGSTWLAELVLKIYSEKNNEDN